MFGEGSSIVIFILFLALMFGMMYFFSIRPQRKRQKAHEALMEELKRGDKVITAGGIYGQIEDLSKDSVVLRIESGATVRMAKGSIVAKREE